jgi:hypothetical protein
MGKGDTIMNNGDKPAMPQAVQHENGDQSIWIGLTKREHFAGLVMQSIIGKHVPESQSDLSLTADLSLRCADALLKALESKV